MSISVAIADLLGPQCSETGIDTARRPAAYRPFAGQHSGRVALIRPAYPPATEGLPTRPYSSGRGRRGTDVPANRNGPRGRPVPAEVLGITSAGRFPGPQARLPCSPGS